MISCRESILIIKDIHFVAVTFLRSHIHVEVFLQHELTRVDGGVFYQMLILIFWCYAANTCSTFDLFVAVLVAVRMLGF